jgi:hypothetical protein
VTAISLLIWIWAAGETRERATLHARLQFSPASNFSMIVFPRSDRQVALEVSGSARSIQLVRQGLQQPLEIVTGTNGIPGEPGTHSISLVNAIQSLPVLSQGNITVLSTEPSTLQVEIDSLTQISVAVEPVLSGATLGGEAVSSPPTVTLTLPSRIVALVPDATVIAEPARSAIAELEPGRRQVILAPVHLAPALRPYSSEISIEPTSVQLAFTVILKTRSINVEAVPVQVAAPAQVLDEYQITIEDADQFLADVVIEGSTDVVKKFEDEKPPVVAFVHLTSEDLARGVTEAPVSLWQLPEGLRVTSVAGEAPRPFISLKVVKRGG